MGRGYPRERGMIYSTVFAHYDVQLVEINGNGGEVIVVRKKEGN